MKLYSQEEKIFYVYIYIYIHIYIYIYTHTHVYVWNFLTLSSIKKILLIHVFEHAKSKSGVYFRQPEPETLDNPEERNIFRIIGVSGVGLRKWIPDLDSKDQKH